MLSLQQIKEIKEHLEEAQNPLFFFDNDDDGLCSFLLLQRFVGRGKGVAIKSFPDLNAGYYRKVNELKPDYIFILDKPLVSEEFFEKANQDNIPVVWIDHHRVNRPKNKKVYYYNPYSIREKLDEKIPYDKDETSESVSYFCYKLATKKEDVWLALIGCISDCYLPDFYKEFEERYPELGKKNPKSAFDLLYDSEIGKISRILDFSLKDTTTNVVNMLRFMMKTKGPMDILEENYKTRQILRRYEQINAKYQELMEKARKLKDNKIIYFRYRGNLSLSSNLANQIKYEFPNKIVVVVYLKEDIANISIRGPRDVRELTLKAIEGIEGASGGGHKYATGAKMSLGDLKEFKKRIDELVNKN